MTRVLVTGVTGQDGSYLAERLVGEGDEVHGLVRPGGAVDGEHGVPAGVVVHEGDLRDPGLWQVLLEACDPDEVYHLAGMSSVAQSWHDPLGSAAVTGLPVAGLLAAVHARSQGRGVRMLQAASAEVFGAAAEVPQNEGTPVRPTSPYGAAKAYAHHLVGVYRGAGVHASSMLLYNHESPRRPPSFVTRKITVTVAAIAAGRADALVLGDLTARRDWGWAPDYVDGMLRAVRHDEPGDYVLATGVSHSVRDFVAAAFAAAGVQDWEPLVRTDPSFVRPVETAEQRGDATRAREVLGWTTTRSFEQVVAAMVAHDQEVLDREKAGPRPGGGLSPG